MIEQENHADLGVLHIFAKGLNQRSLLESCLSVASPDDTVLFIEDGVYWSAPSPLATACLKHGYNYYYLLADAEARGIARPHDQFRSVDYGGFVDLTITCKTSVSWF